MSTLITLGGLLLRVGGGLARSLNCCCDYDLCELPTDAGHKILATINDGAGCDIGTTNCDFCSDMGGLSYELQWDGSFFWLWQDSSYRVQAYCSGGKILVTNLIWCQADPPEGIYTWHICMPCSEWTADFPINVPNPFSCDVYLVGGGSIDLDLIYPT